MACSWNSGSDEFVTSSMDNTVKLCEHVYLLLSDIFPNCLTLQGMPTHKRT